MSTRQALGVLTNIGYAGKNNNNNIGNVNATGRVTGQKATDASTIFKSVSNNNLLLSQIQFNDENEPPQFVLSSLQQQQQQIQKVKSSVDLDFEIFQEKSAPEAESNKLVEPTGRVEQRVEFIDDDDEDEDEDEDEEEEEDDDEDEESEEEDKENDEALEEEGISRLNLAATMSDSCSSTKISNKEMMIIMDSCNLSSSSSSLSHNDSSSSPMMLDDTIKFLSTIDDERDDEDELDDEHCHHDDDEDEETKKRIEIQERENTLMNCLEYKDDILAYMRKLECENRPKPNYIKKQLDITSSMRSILVDWLVEVCEEYKLNVETLYLAANYTDRFLSQMSVLRGKLQLVGTASMYIASKYEEITPPDVNEFVYITDDTYTKKQVLRMEHLLLKVLDFRMSQPTVNWFLSHYLRFIKLHTSLGHANNIDLYQRIENLARYLAELTLIDADTYLTYLPSQIAASAIYLAMYTLGRPWTRQIADIVGYAHDLSQLKPCIADLLKTMQQAESHPQQAIQEKYKQSKYDYVALIEPPKSLPSFAQ